ncbi:Protein of unknown function [Pyronema omphalodes CBS 100304]|uniref:Uncharacterized protein n=1 Tax=Pyronema omphalodes (strain CBS 100304) TaxID=1076935 RepID=U4L665_PYROM|nr:Protein of unknown function [Pyronema omphalodes CBS 100304]
MGPLSSSTWHDLSCVIGPHCQRCAPALSPSVIQFSASTPPLVSRLSFNSFRCLQQSLEIVERHVCLVNTHRQRFVIRCIRATARTNDVEAPPHTTSTPSFLYFLHANASSTWSSNLGPSFSTILGVWCRVPSLQPLHGRCI